MTITAGTGERSLGSRRPANKNTSRFPQLLMETDALLVSRNALLLSKDASLAKKAHGVKSRTKSK